MDEEKLIGRMTVFILKYLVSPVLVGFILKSLLSS